MTGDQTVTLPTTIAGGICGCASTWLRIGDLAHLVIRSQGWNGRKDIRNHALTLATRMWPFGKQWQRTGGLLLVEKVDYRNLMSITGLLVRKPQFWQTPATRLAEAIPPGSLLRRAGSSMRSPDHRSGIRG